VPADINIVNFALVISTSKALGFAVFDVILTVHRR